MRASKKLALCATLAISALGCEKSSDPAGKPSGELNKDESALFDYLPGDANIVFGGNYGSMMKHWQTSPLKTFADKAAASVGNQDAMQKYMSCWVEEVTDGGFAGAVTFTDGDAQLSMLFDDLSVETMKKCAEGSGYTFNIDAEGKSAKLAGVPDGMGGTTDASYYFIEKNTVLFSMKMSLSLGALPESPSAEELATFVADAKKNPASKSASITAMVAKADRSKALWFAGSGAGTPVADKLSGGHGWFDIDASGMSIGFAVDFPSADIPKEAAKGFSQLKQQVGSLPAPIKGPVKKILAKSSLKASGKSLKGKVVVSNKAMEELVPAMGMLGGF